MSVDRAVPCSMIFGGEAALINIAAERSIHLSALGNQRKPAKVNADEPRGDNLDDSAQDRQWRLHSDIRSAGIRREYLRCFDAQRVKRTCRSYREGQFAAWFDHHVREKIHFHRRR